MNKIELITLRKYLSAECSRLAHEHLGAVNLNESSPEVQTASFAALQKNLCRIETFQNAIDLLLSLKTAPGPDLQPETLQTHAKVQMLFDALSVLYTHLNETLSDDNTNADSVRRRVEDLRQEYMREHIAALSVQLKPLSESLFIPDADCCTAGLLAELEHYLNNETASMLRFQEQATAMAGRIPERADRLRSMSERHAERAERLRASIDEVKSTELPA